MSIKKIIKQGSNSFLQIDGSKFYCYGYKITSQQDVEQIIKGLWKENKKAVHICYGYVLEKNNQIFEKFDDDNEPKNSAGKRILTSITNNNFINTLVVVVRYKTKSLLGLGLLSRCYFNVTELLLKDNNNFLEYKNTTIVEVQIKDPKNLSSLLNFIKANKLEIISQSNDFIVLNVDDDVKKILENTFIKK